MGNRIIVVIPCYSETSGGIKRMLRLTQQLLLRGYNVGLHVQKGEFNATLPIDVTTGTWIIDFPNADTIITYSDDPLINEYKQIQNAKILVYMLSYGMAPERERAVVKSGATILCSTRKIVDEIKSDLGVDAHKIGFSLEEQVNSFYVEGVNRRKYLAIMYHHAKNKNYDTAVEVCNCIDIPVIVFGQRPTGKIRVPKRTESVYFNVNHEKLRQIFNRSKLYLNTSLYEGLNLTPFEAMLCGCPSVLVDGAAELYHGDLYLVSTIDNLVRICNLWLNNYMLVNNQIIAEDAHNVAKSHTWDNVFSKLKGLLL